MAETWRAKWQGTAGITKNVAIKRILPGLAEDEQFVAMFVSEAKVLATLSHGNIAQVFDVGQVDGEYYIAMEYVDGPSLKSVLEKAAERGEGCVPVPIALYIILELAKALHYAHTGRDDAGKPMSIVHRDVSPENIMLSWQGQLKVIDFGIARSALPERPKTEAGIMKGKVQYMSPEQARAQDIDALTDVWASGIVLFEMLCGKPPVENASYEGLMALWRGEGPKPSALNRNLNSELDRLVGKALAVSRTDRFRSEQHLHDAVADILHRDYPGVSQAWLSAYLIELYGDYLKAEGRVIDVPMQARAALRSAVAGKSQKQRTQSKVETRAVDPDATAALPVHEPIDNPPTPLQRRAVTGKRSVSSTGLARPVTGKRDKVAPELEVDTGEMTVGAKGAVDAGATMVHEEPEELETTTHQAHKPGSPPKPSLAAPTRAEGVEADDEGAFEDRPTNRAQQAPAYSEVPSDELAINKPSIVADTHDVPTRSRRSHADLQQRPTNKKAESAGQLSAAQRSLLIKITIGAVAVVLVGIVAALVLL